MPFLFRVLKAVSSESSHTDITGGQIYSGSSSIGCSSPIDIDMLPGAVTLGSEATAARAYLFTLMFVRCVYFFISFIVCSASLRRYS